MFEAMLQTYRAKTLPSSIYTQKDLVLAEPGGEILEWDAQRGSIQDFTALAGAVCETTTAVSCLPFPLGWPLKHVQVQDTGTAEGQGTLAKAVYEAITTVSRLPFPLGWPFTDLQIQDTGTAEDQGPSRTVQIDNAFTATDLLDNEEQQIMERIFLFRTTLSIPYKNKLAERFIALFNDVKEEDPLSVGPSIESLRVFYNFLKVHDNLKMPSISLTPDNLIYASWRDENKFFSAIFSKNDFAQFTVFEPNSKDPDRNVRLSGTIAVEAARSCGIYRCIKLDIR